MLLCNCKAKIKKLSTDFAIALLSARLGQTVCYLLAFCLSLVCCPLFTAVLVRWLGGSFGFFSVGLCVCKKYKCATKCVG
jgi:hypothetical protein